MCLTGDLGESVEKETELLPMKTRFLYKFASKNGRITQRKDTKARITLGDNYGKAIS